MSQCSAAAGMARDGGWEVRYRGELLRSPWGSSAADAPLVVSPDGGPDGIVSRTAATHCKGVRVKAGGNVCMASFASVCVSLLEIKGSP